MVLVYYTSKQEKHKAIVDCAASEASLLVFLAEQHKIKVTDILIDTYRDIGKIYSMFRPTNETA